MTEKKKSDPTVAIVKQVVQRTADDFQRAVNSGQIKSGRDAQRWMRDYNDGVQEG